MTSQGRHHVRDDGVLRRVRDGPEVSAVVDRWSRVYRWSPRGRCDGRALRSEGGVVVVVPVDTGGDV